MMRSNLFRCHNLYVILLFFQLISHITRTRPCILYLRGYLIFRFFSESCKKDECRVTKTFFSCQKTSVTIKLTTFCLCGTRPYTLQYIVQYYKQLCSGARRCYTCAHQDTRQEKLTFAKCIISHKTFSGIENHRKITL